MEIEGKVALVTGASRGIGPDMVIGDYVSNGTAPRELDPIVPVAHYDVVLDRVIRGDDLDSVSVADTLAVLRCASSGKPDRAPQPPARPAPASICTVE